MHRRLLTRERQGKLGICQEDHCVICGEEAETIDHLFFECKYSRNYLNELLDWLNIRLQQHSLGGIWRRMTRNIRGKACRSAVSTVLVATIYHIWKVRNEALWNQKVLKPHKLVSMVKEECRMKIQIIMERKSTSRRQKMWIKKIM